jgi:transcriptional regulator NrdR family protein
MNYQRIKLSHLQRCALRGVDCPKCGHKESKVTQTRKKGFGIVRVRTCGKCGHEFITGETTL